MTASSQQVLTLDSKSYIISECQSFYFDGFMSSCPEWFLNLLEDYHYIKGQDIRGLACLHLIGMANGHPTITPNSLVFVSTGSVGPIVQTISGTKPHGQSQ